MPDLLLENTSQGLSGEVAPPLLDATEIPAAWVPRSAREWEEALFPECRGSLGKDLGLEEIAQKLADLGFRKSVEAEGAGFTCIRQYVDKGSNSKPGLWVSPENMPALGRICASIALVRAENVGRKTTGKRRAQEVVARKSAERREWLEAMEASLVAWPGITDSERAQVLRALETSPAATGKLKSEIVIGVVLLERVLALHATLSEQSRQEVYHGLVVSDPEVARALQALNQWAEPLGDSAATAVLSRAIAQCPGAVLGREKLGRAWQEVSMDLFRARLSKRTPPLLAFEGATHFRFGRSLSVSADVAGVPLENALVAYSPLQERGAFTVVPEQRLRSVSQRLDLDLEVLRKLWTTTAQAISDLLSADTVPEQVLQVVRPAAFKLLKAVVDEVSAEKAIKSMRSLFRREMTAFRTSSRILAAATTHSLDDFKRGFPVARGLSRRLTLYIGPTNSGKTYRALEHLAVADSGIYLAPLRLLALEGQSEIASRGKEASFITGEEREIRPGARFVSSTIEMLDLDRPVDACVIDEAQMLSDPDRGWAWTQAICGAPARHVILTGSADCLPRVRDLAEYLGETLEVVECSRLAPLVALPHSTAISALKPGTAIIVFSRRDVLEWKRSLEPRHSVAVLYGNLSPDVRRAEAARFRSGQATVLVATDAIAMGLNLPIETILFGATNKWTPRTGSRELTASELRQIAGRAGRYGVFATGSVGTVRGTTANIRLVQDVVSGNRAHVPPPSFVRVRPAWEHVHALAGALRKDSLDVLLVAFRKFMTFDSSLLRPDVSEEMLVMAQVVDRFPKISLRDRLVWSHAPLDQRNGYVMGNFMRWLRMFAAEETPALEHLGHKWQVPGVVAGTHYELEYLESCVKSLTVYAWLAYRYPERFVDLARCEHDRRVLNSVIERTIQGKMPPRTCGMCEKPLPPHFPHANCDGCYRGGRQRYDDDDWY